MNIRVKEKMVLRLWKISIKKEIVRLRLKFLLVRFLNFIEI
ncbi:hypothetical protein P689_122296 [Candidatus Riesia pediculischaeffi PTSU]|uniref:Uncharacterized protein n=1 Tax=Candidatus Riesia pediculischaeffi PTSU TaxID=1401651 RepID=A0A0C1V5Y3_9ENTR|nr:hypothetical protein P689_122296 [Candidatus Riesia pediculischaeffi PTSU]